MIFLGGSLGWRVKALELVIPAQWAVQGLRQLGPPWQRTTDRVAATTETGFLTVLEHGGPISRCQNGTWWEFSPQGADRRFLPGCSYDLFLVLMCGEQAHRRPLFKGHEWVWTHLYLIPPSLLPCSKYSHTGVRTSTEEFGGTHIFSP